MVLLTTFGRRCGPGEDTLVGVTEAERQAISARYEFPYLEQCLAASHFRSLARPVRKLEGREVQMAGGNGTTTTSVWAVPSDLRGQNKARCGTAGKTILAEWAQYRPSGTLMVP